MLFSQKTLSFCNNYMMAESGDRRRKTKTTTKEHKIMDPSRPDKSCQWWFVMYCCWPCHHSTHLLMATCNGISGHVIKLIWYSSLVMIMSSLFSNDLHSQYKCQPQRAPSGCDGMGELQHAGINLQHQCDAITSACFSLIVKNYSSSAGKINSNAVLVLSCISLFQQYSEARIPFDLWKSCIT